MKKLFTLLVMLLLSIGSTWATTITLDGSTGTGGVVASGFGFTLPDEAKDGTVYSLSSFTVGLRGTYTYAYYMAICTEKKATGAAASYPESKVIAVSNNVPTAGTSGRFTYNFSKPVKLVKGVTYYVQFLTANTPTDGNYETIQQGVYVATGSSGDYPPSIYSGNGIYTNYTPNFTTTLTEISSSESEYWSSLNSNSIDHAVVQRIKVVTPSTNSYYRLSAFSLYLCNTNIASSEHNNYMLISKKSDASGTISTDDIVGISKNHPSASGNNVEERFFFDDICLDGNTAYYLYFTASNTPTDGAYTLCKEKIKQSSTTTNPSVWWNNTLQNWEPRYYSTLDVLKKVTFSQPVAVNGGDAVSTIYVATDGTDELELSNQYKYKINGGDPLSYSTASTEISSAGTADITVTVVGPTDEQTSAYNTVLGWKSDVFVADGLVRDASNYSGNAIIESTDGTGLPALLDNNTSTYCHTLYQGKGTDPGADHYIQAYIEDGVSDFYLYTYKRNVNNRPTQIDITASNDGSEWTTITSLTSGLIDKDDFLSDKISLGDTYKYIRFTVPKTNTGDKFGDHVFFTYSEFWLLPSNTHTDAAFSTLKSLVPAVELSSKDIEEINDINLEIWKEALIASAGESRNFGKVGWPSATAYSTFCDAINALTVDDDYESDAETAMTTLWSTVTYPATGYYYLHNKGTGRYAFSDETVSTNQDYLNDESRTSKYIWKVTLDGANVKVYSLTGHGITLNNQGGEQTGNLALGTPDANSYKDARGALYMGCIQDPNQNTFTKNGGAYVSATNPMQLTYFNGDRNNNKAYWIFEPVDESAYDVYTVSFVNAPGNNYVTYSGNETTGNKKVYDGGCYFMTKDATISASDFTGESVTNYSSVVSIDANNITITYTVSNWEAFINDYIEINDVWTKLANAGKPGYPENTPQKTMELTLLKTIITGGTYNEEVYNALQSAYDTYKSQDVITTVPAGKFYRFKAAKSGKFLKGEDSGTTSTETSGYHLLNTVDEEGAKSIFYFKANAESNPSLLGYSSGRYVRYTSHLAPVGADGVSTFEFESPNTYFGALSVKANATIGGWGRYLYSHTGSQDYANQQGSKAAETDWYLEEVTSLPVTFKKKGLGYTTFFTPVALQIPANTHAYVCQRNNETLTFYEITKITTKDGDNDVATIPANTAVLLFNEDAGTDGAPDLTTVSFKVTSCKDEGGNDIQINNNSLDGTLAAETMTTFRVVDEENYDIYSLRTSNSGANVGFFKKTEGDCAGFKSWLRVEPTTGDARNFTIYFDGEEAPTGIVEALGLENDNVEIYDLNGRKLSTYKKGINIVNGKKVMVQ